MEISAIETLSDAMLNADMALHSANTTLHWTNSEPDIECEAVAKASELKSLNDNRVRPEVYEHDVGHKVISGKWVLKRLGEVKSRTQRAAWL